VRDYRAVMAEGCMTVKQLRFRL